jgi:hypothetical protein
MPLECTTDRRLKVQVHNARAGEFLHSVDLITHAAPHHLLPLIPYILDNAAMRSSSITPALVSVAVLAQHAKTQIVGCDTVKCPSSGCVVGDVTNLDLGIANFTSGISPNNPLTWTVGLADIPHDNSINDTWLKSYYLSTPPNLDLRSMFEISGCALFFETATSA